MAPQILYRVCYGSPTPSSFQKSLLTIRPAILHDYRRHKVRECDYPAITPSPTSSVRGTFVQGLTDADLWRLDIFEGTQYTREKVRVNILKVVGDDDGKGNVEGEEVNAKTYVWADGKTDLEEAEWDFAEFRQEKMRRWFGDCEEYEGESRPSIRGLSRTIDILRPVTDSHSEVDEAVKAAAGKDPTGGRGADGAIVCAIRSPF